MSRKAILIMVDSQRWDMVNCYKETGLQTPNLDRLAAERRARIEAAANNPDMQP